MAFELNDTLSPLSRNERNKVNENWDRITNALNLLQSQVNIIAGGDISDIVQELNDAMERLNEMLQDGEVLIDDLDAAMLVVNGYIDTLQDYVPRMEDGVTDMEALLPVLTNLRDELTTLNNNATIAENGRVSAEGTRVTNENTRQNNEATRQANELIRQETLEEMELLVDNFESYVYNANVEYDFPNFVLYNGSTYLALQRVQGLTPTNDGVNWRLAAQRGVDGSGSVSSVNGMAPDANGNVQIDIGGDIINNLTSTRTDASLSANMGRQLSIDKVNISDKANTAEMQSGTNDTKWVTPLGTTNAITNRIATTSEVNVGTNANKLISPLRLAELTGKKEDLNTTNKDNLVASTNEVNTKVNQSEYQIPVVNTRQIQVSKPSALNRIFFKITTALADGVAITVSTDAGATSKPLVDIDENAVTSLEKGFHEIVESASFFTLRSKGLNLDLTELADKIGSPAVATDDYDTLISKLQDAKDSIAEAVTDKGVVADGEDSLEDLAEKIEQIDSGGIAYATGEIAASASGSFQNYGNTSNVTSPFVEVSGLNFKPKKILINPPAWTNASGLTVYYESVANFSEYVVRFTFSQTNASSAAVFGLKANAGVAYVNSTGFKLPVLENNKTYTWEAYG